MASRDVPAFPRALYLLGVGQHLFLAGEKTRPDHFGVTDVGNPVGDRGTKSAHSDRPSVRVCMRGRSIGICFLCIFDAGERWISVLKMLAQMASTRPS